MLLSTYLSDLTYYEVEYTMINHEFFPNNMTFEVSKSATQFWLPNLTIKKDKRNETFREC